MPKETANTTDLNMGLAKAALAYPFPEYTELPELSLIQLDDPEFYEEDELTPTVDVSFWWLYIEPEDHDYSSRTSLELEALEKHQEQFVRLLDNGRGYSTLKRLQFNLQRHAHKQHDALQKVLKELWESHTAVNPETFTFHQVGIWDGDDLISCAAKFAKAWTRMSMQERFHLYLRLEGTGSFEAFNRWRRAVAYLSIFAETAERLKALRIVLLYFEIFGCSTGLQQLDDPEDAEALHHVYTRTIGKTLLEHKKREGKLPDFGGKKERLYAWAGKVIGRSSTTAYNAMQAAGCLTPGRQGRAGEGLEETLSALMALATDTSSPESGG